MNVQLYLCQRQFQICSLFSSSTDTLQSVNASRNRVCNYMIPNPIYDGDGPLYDRVGGQPHKDPDTSPTVQKEPDLRYETFQQSSVGATFHEYSELKTANGASIDPLTAAKLQSASFCTSTTESNTVIDQSTPQANRYEIDRSDTDHGTRSATSVKKSGKERNILQLRLCLSENDTTNTNQAAAGPNESSTRAPQSSEKTDFEEEDEDEVYTVMNPVGSIQCHRVN